MYVCMYVYVCIFNVPKTQNKTAYIEFIEKPINAQFPHHLKDPGLFELIKTYQVHSHSRSWGKHKNNKRCFSYGEYFTDKTIIAKPLSNIKRKRF